MSKRGLFALSLFNKQMSFVDFACLFLAFPFHLLFIKYWNFLKVLSFSCSIFHSSFTDVRVLLTLVIDASFSHRFLGRD